MNQAVTKQEAQVPEMGLEKSGNMGADAEMRGEFWETVGLPEGLLAPPGPGF